VAAGMKHASNAKVQIARISKWNATSLLNRPRAAQQAAEKLMPCIRARL
jgi:hypothetical protein